MFIIRQRKMSAAAVLSDRIIKGGGKTRRFWFCRVPDPKPVAVRN